MLVENAVSLDTILATERRQRRIMGLRATRIYKSRHVRVEDVCRCHVGGERVTAGKSAWFARAGKSITPPFCSTTAPLESGHLGYEQEEERPVAVRSALF